MKRRIMATVLSILILNGIIFVIKTPVGIAIERSDIQIDYNKSSVIRVILDGKLLNFDVKPQIINGRTLVPMRTIFEALGLSVEWENATQTAKGTDSENSIAFIIGSNKAIVNNEEKILDVPASIIEDRTMIPLRFLSENMGNNVVWVGESNLILISKSDIIEWRYGGYEIVEPYKEYEVKYINGIETGENRYNGKKHDVKIEWKNAGYESIKPYKEYEIKYVEGIKTSETRYTGKTKPQEVQYKEIDYTWEYPYGLLTWSYSLRIPVEAVNIYKSIDRKYISGYSYYVTHEEDDEYMNALANVFVNTINEEGYSEWDLINLAVSFVQSLKYVPDKIGTGYDEYPKFPLETLYDQGGDCEDSSILLASLLRELGYGTVLVVTEDHMGVGIKTSDSGNFQFVGTDFYYIETTSPGWEIGELPQYLEGEKITILPVN